MADEYALSMLKVSLGQICQNIGFQGGTNVSLTVLLDIYRRYMESMCRTLHRYCDHSGRTEPNLEDVELMFEELRIPLREMNDYVNQVAAVPFKHKVPIFPVQRPSKLKIPSSESEEIKTRPDYIPIHLPLMHPENEPTPIVQEPEKLSTDDLSTDGKLNAARISAHRATISSLGKQDLSQCGDLIGDFSDFDAIKAGLVKFIRVPTPPPPRVVTPLNIPYPVTMSPPPAQLPTTVIIKPPQPPLIKVEEKSYKKKPTVLDVRSHAPKITSTISSNPTKLKINFPMSAYKKKRLTPLIIPKKEKKFVHPSEPGTSGATASMVPKRRGRPPGSVGPKKLAAMAAMDMATMAAALAAAQQQQQLQLQILQQQQLQQQLLAPLLVPPILEPKLNALSGSAVADVLASLDSSTASSSVEDLVTSVIEETRNQLKAQQKASDHFDDTVLSVISAKTEASSPPPRQAQKFDEPTLLAGAGHLTLVIPKKPEAAAVTVKTEPDMENSAQSQPSTSTAKIGDAGNEEKREKLKSILQVARRKVNKDIIKQRLKEKSARKEEEEKKLRDVVEKIYPPIAKRQEEPTVTPTPIPIPPPLPQPVPVPTPVAPPPPAPVPTPVTTAVSTAPSVTSAESSKPPRRPPGIPPTTLRISPTKPKFDKPAITVRPPKPDYKRMELFPPLFQPEHHIAKSVPSSSDSRKVAPLVISKPKPSNDQPTSQNVAPSAPAPVTATVGGGESKKEPPKIVIKLGGGGQASAGGAKTTIDEKEKERKKKHHDKEKEKEKEKHKEKHRDKPSLSSILPVTVKKEKKEKEREKEKEKFQEPPKTEPIPSTSGAIQPPKGLKLKINMKAKMVERPASSSEKEKLKEKKPKPLSPFRPTYEDPVLRTNVVLTPPPKSPSAHSKSPSIAGVLTGIGGYESPPPRTPSPGSSVPPSPIYVETHESHKEKRRDEAPVVAPPAKKQRVEPWPMPPEPRNVIKIDKTQFASSVKNAPTIQIKKQGGGDEGWYCPVCNVAYQEGADMIACDACDRWYHWVCVGLLQAPPDDENWYCQECRVRRASGSSKHGSRKQSAITIKKHK